MKIRKLTYTDGTGQKKTRGKFYGIFSDHKGVIRRMPLFPDRKASEEAGRKVSKLVDLRGANETLPDELTRWIETTTPSIREALAEYGIIATTKLAASRPVVDHIADWKEALLAKGNTPRHAELVTTRARKAFDASGFVFWSDVSASKLQAHLHDLRNGGQGISAQTCNFYLQAVKQFGRWMVRDGRASESPLAHLQGLNVRTDRRHDRRALAVEELRWLLQTTEAGADSYGMTGPERAMLYRLAVETGLRTGELRSLTRASFGLHADEPAVTIAAAYAKNRRQDTLPLRSETADKLRTFLANKLPNAIAFNVPPRTDVSRMFRADLNAAKAAWVANGKGTEERAGRERSNFLAYKDDAGRFADAHALRHTFVSNLVAGGVHPKTAQRLARHGTIGLTMDRYTHVYQGDLATALSALPDLTIPAVIEVRATGTDANASAIRVSPHVSLEGGIERNRAESGGVLGQSADAAEFPGNSAKLTVYGRAAKVQRTAGGVAERPIAPVLKTGGPARVP